MTLLPYSPDSRPLFQCPVCYFWGLMYPPYKTWPPPPGVPLRPPYEDLLGRASYEVCPRCGFEFGNDDNPGTAEPLSFDDYRREWEADGKPWFENPPDKPEN